MLLKLAVLAIGVMELLVPRRFVDFWMDLAVEGDEPIELRQWVYTTARLEGLLVIGWFLVRAVRGHRSDADAAGRDSDTAALAE